MNTRLAPLVLAALGLGVVLTPVNTARPAEIAPALLDKGVEVLARGPVHEAYAAPNEAQLLPGPLVVQQPPDPIDEQPPDQRPEGADVHWVPGYWSWDDEQDDFVWVSGFWRDVPPGREWVPGHWQQVEGGWQWSAGFWATVGQDEIQYLPAPPPSVDAGPSTPAPEENSTYIPGCWVYRETRYLWRPGFWVGYRPDWAWVPAHYSWTPAGFVFIDGYWDHPLHERGLLFAPVHLDLSLLGRRQWTYVPHYVVQPDALLSCLFVRPSGAYYYFGDYFGDRYEQRGFVAWVDYHPARNMDDGNFAFYRRSHLEDRRWEDNLRGLYEARRCGDVMRPPHTLSQQTQVVNNITINKTANSTITKNINITHVQNVTMVAPLAQLNNTAVTGLAALDPSRDFRRGARVPSRAIKLAALSETQQLEEHKAIAQGRETAVVRRKMEARVLASKTVPTKATDPPQAMKVELPKRSPSSAPTKPAVQQPPVPQPSQYEVRPIPKHEVPKPTLPARVLERLPETPKRDAPRPAQIKKDTPQAPPAKDARPLESARQPTSRPVPAPFHRDPLPAPVKKDVPPAPPKKASPPAPPAPPPAPPPPRLQPPPAPPAPRAVPQPTPPAPVKKDVPPAPPKKTSPPAPPASPPPRLQRTPPPTPPMPPKKAVPAPQPAPSRASAPTTHPAPQLPLAAPKRAVSPPPPAAPAHRAVGVLRRPGQIPPASVSGRRPPPHPWRWEPRL